MKRKNLYITSFLALTLGLASCSKSFLELEPKTGQVEANYYKTEADAQAAVFSIYDSYQTMYAADVLGMSEAFSDDAFAGGNDPKDFPNFVQSENTDFSPETGDVRGLWERCYQGIYRANLYLGKQSQITFTTTGLQARLEAEAKFLRGYMYWDLARHYGWVPIITSVLPSPDDYKALPQNTPTQVYTQVAADLLAALPVLPETVSASETGRITKGACQALIARIYLYHTGISQIAGLGLTAESLGDGTTKIDKAFAKAQLSDIISKGHYSLVAKYSDVFDWSNQNNSEILLAQVYSNLGLSGWGDVTQANGNVFTQRCGVRDPKPTTFTSHGWSACTITWDLVEAFGSDPRKATTVFDAETELTSYSTDKYMNTGYFNRKYMPQTAYKTALNGDVELNWNRNTFDIRYSDVLLMAAELDVDGKGLQYINDVHERATGNRSITDILQPTILKERRLEFAGEGLRKWDLLRAGLATAKAACEKSFTNRPAGLYNDEMFMGRVFNENSWGMLPIPGSEIRNCNAGVLKQMVDYYKNK